MERAAKGEKPETQNVLKSVPRSWGAAAAEAGREGSLFRGDSSRASSPRADGPLSAPLVVPTASQAFPSRVRPRPRCRQRPGAACWTVRAVPREDLATPSPREGPRQSCNGKAEGGTRTKSGCSRLSVVAFELRGRAESRQRPRNLYSGLSGKCVDLALMGRFIPLWLAGVWDRVGGPHPPSCQHRGTVLLTALQSPHSGRASPLGFGLRPEPGSRTICHLKFSDPPAGPVWLRPCPFPAGAAVLAAGAFEVLGEGRMAPPSSVPPSPLPGRGLSPILPSPRPPAAGHSQQGCVGQGGLPLPAPPHPSGADAPGDIQLSVAFLVLALSGAQRCWTGRSVG